MIYIVEGIDRAGKSTLAKLLAQSIGCRVFHDEFKPYYVDNMVDHATLTRMLNIKYNTLLQTLSLPDDVVVDRFHLTEAVYNGQRGQYFNYSSFENIMLDRLQVKLILVEPMSIAGSSIEHGSNLQEHWRDFLRHYDNSKLDKMLVTQYDIFQNPYTTVRSILNNG
jgi:thymidylate kinase